MANATTPRQHPNAPLTVEGRRRMVRCVTDRGWTVEATAERFQVDAKTVRKWRDRWLAEGDDGLHDRSARRHRSPNRTPRQLPGELIHVDIKKIAGIPDGGGWRVRGRGYRGEGAKSRQVGYRYIHTAIDDRSRIAYSEILDDEQGVTAAGFWRRAAAWYLTIGIRSFCPGIPFKR